MRGGRRCAGQRGKGDVAGRLASRGAILPLELWSKAMQGAGPDVPGACWGVWDTGAGGAALG